MAYRLFSTENAHYVLDLGNHIQNRRNIKIFEGIDALVLEFGNSSPEAILESKGSIGANKDLVALCGQRQIPIYFSDVRLHDYITDTIENEKTAVIGNLALLFIAGYVGFSKRRSKGIFDRAIQRVYAEHVYNKQLPVDAGRDAINARKIEEYVVPDVRQQKPYGQRKIGIHFGAMHMGLKQNLCSKERRDLAIFHQRKLYGEDFAPYDPATLHTVTVAHFFEGCWITERRMIDLFPK